MKELFRFALLGLLLSVSQTWANSKPGGRMDAPGSFAAPKIHRVSVAEHARVGHEARQRVESLAGRMQDSGALIDAIRAEVDPVSREAQWSAWLDLLSATGELESRQLEALATLQKSTPMVVIPHHEFPSRTMPAFALAERAGVLLARHARLNQARAMATRPADLTEALEADIGSAAFAAALEALALVSSESLAGVVDRARERASDAPAAARILLRVAEVEPAHEMLLPEIVDHGDVATARRALRLAMDRGAPKLSEIAAVALARGELGGLALIAARQSGMHPDAFCWTLLDDPSLGADAARMLAEDSDRLLEEISSRIDDASELARLRMLLALRLRGTFASREMLAELAGAPWLSEQQRTEVRSWR